MATEEAVGGDVRHVADIAGVSHHRPERGAHHRPACLGVPADIEGWPVLFVDQIEGVRNSTP
jgi:hypothetical protein